MSNAKERLDRAFSRYIRRRDCPQGTGRCISCGRRITYAECDAGHYISRGHTATRWDVRNVHAQCRVCNRMKEGNAAAYRRSLVALYGAEAVEKLERRRHAVVKLTESDYETLTDFFNRQTAKQITLCSESSKTWAETIK